MSVQIFRYQLDKSSKKHPCPNCQKRRFVRYVDTGTGECIADHVGRCDREQSCQYHYPPREYFEANPTITSKLKEQVVQPLPPPKELSFISERYLFSSMRHYEMNPFTTWLKSLFKASLVEHLIQHFYIGTSKRYGGSTVFWQVDTNLKIRQAKIMHYDPKTGRRNKSTGAYFAGKAILKKQGIQDPQLHQCLFGLHQLSKDQEKTIAIVESEKTAIVMHAFSTLGQAPDYTWLATGGKTGCRWKSPETWAALRKRKVILYPDLGAYELWETNAKYIPTNVYISGLLNMSATEEQRQAGFDVADFFLEAFVYNA